MCLMFLKPKDSKVSTRLLLNAYDHNHNGFGLMYSEKNRVKIVKGLFNSIEILRIYEEFKNRDLAVHFRYCTLGGITKKNAHPFKILSKSKGDKIDLAVMHNGVIQGLSDIPKGRSDTVKFVYEYLKPILALDPELIFNKQFCHLVSRFIGPYNKLLFMDGQGRTAIINDSSGKWRKNLWFSNTYSMYAQRSPRGAYWGKEITSMDQIDNLQFDQDTGQWCHIEGNRCEYFPLWKIERFLSKRTERINE